MGQLKPTQVLNKAYRQIAVETTDFEHFKSALQILLDNVSDGQREETQKEHLRNFLSETFYKPYYMAPEEDIDLAVRLDKTAKSNIGLLIEVKSTTNKSEMISVDNLNKKALQELLLYYLKERVTKKNTDIKYLIATNICEYFIFDAQEFEQKFYQNKKLRREFQDFQDGRKTSNKTDFFYTEIASPFIEEVQGNLEYTYLNIYDYHKYLREDGNNAPKKLIELYKIFSDTHLLKLSFQTDSNSLNRGFYSELLHIIGIEEKKEGNKTVIVRKSIEKRSEASLLENTINQLDAEDCLYKIKNIALYGSTREERLFNVAMELCITWINRILFLKLLEAQMLKYHNGKLCYKFLTIKKIRDFDDLNTLFFQVLARNFEHRTPSILKNFEYVPYLNSSLFEVTELESDTIKINSLSQREELPLLPSSVLKNKKGNLKVDSLPTLGYLFAFLDSYNFASEGSEEVQEEAKTLINASVLGLIFEKINGHKDGSVFTPGIITMYMCHEAITKTVLQKFNGFYGWNCTSVIDLYNKIDDISKANDLINSIRICDPAVGSGHFLVSALNELIYLKYELGILVDVNGKRIRKQDYTFAIENDELIVTDSENNLFTYNPCNEESRRMQETLFREKKLIIENCLFGVDINPNSVKICRLRLWIELLKNAYYTQSSNYQYLETLPNIDINIKCGNSLVYRFNLEDSIKSVLRETGITIKQYKNGVAKYKNAQDKEEKKELEILISEIKSKLKTEIGQKEPKRVKLNRYRAELNDLLTPQLFEFTKKEQKERQKRIEFLHRGIKVLEDYFQEICSNKIYLGAFEWRLEFPEVLDDEGNFIGFDCIIGNPPILRGRDIKRYGYNWAGLWIIATFPSRHYNIEDFPAVKSYFLSVGIERLEQTGEVHTVNGEKIKARKKTCNKWFETQDSISYWEDFYKPKIVWKIIGNQMAFAYDKNQFIMNNACYIMTGEHLDYLLSILNSQAILWYSYVTNMNKTGVGDVQVGGQNIITFPIPAYSDNKNILAKMADCVTNQKISLKSVDYQIENIISEIFGFTTDERNFLNTFANSLRKKG